MSQFRVAYLAGTLRLGGAELELVNQVKALQRIGWDSVVFTLLAGGLREQELLDLGVDVVPVPRFGGAPARALAVARLVRRHRPTVLHTQHFFTNTYAVTTPLLAPVVAIGSVQSTVAGAIRKVGWTGKQCLMWPRWLTLNSRYAHRRALELGRLGERTFFLDNGLDLESIDRVKVAEPPPWPPDVPVVLGVGSLFEVKRFDRFIDVIGRVRALVPNAIGVIAGDGPLRDHLLARVRGAGLAENAVRFLGQRQDAIALMKAATVLLLTSEREGSPNVVQEALACGLPVVATAVGGVPDLVQEGETGFLRRAEDVEGLADCVGTLLRDDQLQRDLGASGRRYARERFGLDRLASDLEAIYTRVQDRR